MSRPSKLNQQLIENICKELAEGLPITYACDLYGITRMSFNNWSRKGEEDYDNDVDSLEAKFFYSIKKAMAEFVKKAGAEIRSGRPGWQGVSWWLERTKQDFMPKQEIKAGDDGKVTVVLGGKIKDVKKSEN